MPEQPQAKPTAAPAQNQQDVTGGLQLGDSARPADSNSDSNNNKNNNGDQKWQSSTISSEPRSIVVVDKQQHQQQQQDTLASADRSQHQLETSESKVSGLFVAARSYQQQQSNKNYRNDSFDTPTNVNQSFENSELDLLGPTTPQASSSTSPSSSIFNRNQNQSQNQTRELANSRQHQVLKRHNLSYLQRVLLRNWPWSIILVLAMASLIIGVVLPALTVYLLQGGFGQCSAPSAASVYRHRLAALGHHSEPLSLIGHASNLDDATPFELGKSLEAKGLYLSDSDLLASASGQQSAAAAAAQGGQPAATGGGAAKPSAFHRLPTSLRPVHYELFVQPYIAPPFNFNGKVNITIKCVAATTNITLHSLQLDLQEQTINLAKLNAAKNSTSTPTPKVKGLRYDKELQYAIVDLDSPLVAGEQYLLSLEYSGFLNDDLAGFYKSSFDSNNRAAAGGPKTTTWVAATQFQATDARRAFPCFDEPVYKATFGIQIKHWKNMTALSNMPIKRSESSQDELWVTDTFDKSVAMSTYLVAFAVTNFESRTEGNMSVWARPGFIETAEYALKIGNKILHFYEDYFGIKFPLPKMDMIALPDFNAGAMENWGLITYRETAMLYDRNVSSEVNKLRIATVVSHELAHQWFGNLVTPKWWDDLWLNEGFATYVEYIGVDHVEPKWHLLDHFALDELQETFRLDALSSSHQISVPVNNPDEVAEIFDKISYGKGASLIRMMNHFIGEQAFKLGLHRYLEALKYSNAEQSDLWAFLSDALRDVSGGKQQIDIGQVMNSWTLQTGFPLVTLKRDYAQQSATLDQRRYQPAQLLKTPKSQMTNTSGVSWEVPVSISHESKLNLLDVSASEQVVWLHQNDSSKPVALHASLVPASPDEWMLINVNQVGYFRVNYDKRNWQLLIEQLAKDHKKLSAINRAQLLDDLFEMARGGLLDYALALDATKYLPKERDYLPWASVLTSLSYLEDMLQRTPLYGDFRDYLSHLVDPYYSRFREFDWTRKLDEQQQQQQQMLLANNNNSLLDSMDLLLSINWACPISEQCIGKARQTFSTWRTTGVNNIAPEFRFATYCQAIEHGNKHDWDFLWKAYEQEQTSAERERIMRALACTKEPWILSKYLDYTFANKSRPVRRQDGALVFRMVAKNLHGHRLAFDYLKENWSTIREYYGRSSFSFGQFIKAISGSMNTRTELQDFVSFYESVKSDSGTGKRSFQNAIEEIETNVEWRERNYKLLDTWIREFHATNVGKPVASATGQKQQQQK